MAPLQTRQEQIFLGEVRDVLVAEEGIVHVGYSHVLPRVGVHGPVQVVSILRRHFRGKHFATFL